MTRDVKTTRAYSDVASFTVTDIDNPIALAQMRGTELRDDLFNEVVAVRREQGAASHFRVKANALEAGMRAPVDPLHSKAIEDLVRFFGRESFTINVASFQERKKVPRQLWQARSTTRYTWLVEPSTRIWMEDGAYIQPDIVGYDSQRFSRGPGNPVVIIEVVHTHWPDLATWQHLERLSRMNHLVLFYFVAEGQVSNWLNFVGVRDGRRLQVSCYLRDGIVYWNDTPKVPDSCLDAAQAYEWLKEDIFRQVRATFDKARATVSGGSGG